MKKVAKKRPVRRRKVTPPKSYPFEQFQLDIDKVLDAFEVITTDPPATFERCSAKVLGEALELSTQRGSEYADSFALENTVTTFTSATMRIIKAIRPDAGKATTIAELRLIQLASIIDLKDARMIGPFKMDTVVDGINYRAVWGQLMKEYVDAKGEVC